MTYCFGEHELDTSVLELRRRGHRLPLPLLPFRLLVHLIERRPAAVSKAELVREVWNGAHVVDGAIRTAACELRRTLGQDGGKGPWIQTVPGFGYRFVGRVDERSVPAWPAAPLVEPVETHPDRALHALLDSCREALERGRRDVFAERLLHLVGLWVEGGCPGMPRDYGRPFSLRPAPAPPIC